MASRKDAEATVSGVEEWLVIIHSNYSLEAWSMDCRLRKRHGMNNRNRIAHDKGKVALLIVGRDE